MKFTPIALAALLVGTGAAHAQQGWTEIDDDAFVVEALGMTVDELDDADIIGADGERIGELDDVLMGTDGMVAVSLDVGGFLGIGEKDVVISVDQLTASADGLMVDMTKEQLEALPEYED